MFAIKKSIRWLAAICLLSSAVLFGDAACLSTDPEFIILTGSYNNQDWVEKNISMLACQTYTNWHLIYIADAPTDDTIPKVQALIQLHGIADKVTLIINPERRGHMANQYDAIHACRNYQVIVIYDGDDWFATEQALERIAHEYHSGAWMTYGQYWYWKKNRLGICKQLPQGVIEKNAIREHMPWTTSHVRTFYAGLYKLIAYEDLLYDGKFFPMSVDVATMMPMLEMAGFNSRFIDMVLLIYNDGNQLNFYQNHMAEQRAIERNIRSRKKYEPLPYALFLEE